MAKFDSKTFNPEAFGKYMNAIPNEKLNRLRSSRAVARDSRLVDAFKNNTQTGSVYAVLPFFGLANGDAQNYDGVVDLTPGNTATYEQGVFTYGRMRGWTEADFSYDVTGGVDFMANVRSQITDYFNMIDQGVLLSILAGVFKMSSTAGAKFVTKHTLDIGSADVLTTDDNKMGATTLNTAIQQACGDHKSNFSLAIMHSSVATGLENLNLITYLKQTDANGLQRDLTLATWNGRLVIVDDDMPVVNKSVGTTGGKQDLYTTYLLGDGALGLEDVGVKVPYEMSRDAKTKGGEDTLIVRRRNAVSVSGISYKKASQASNSPTNAELETATNWDLVTDGTNAINDKLIPIARIISRV
ncbi:MAG: major capsid protein [Eubacteriaceae bacterium]|nr:major capsid protein [Eubacteriaceae bacterium]